MMKLNVVVVHEGGHDVGVDLDGTRHANLDHTELLDDATASTLAASVGGCVIGFDDIGQSDED